MAKDEEGGGGGNLPWIIIGGAGLLAFFFLTLYKVGRPFEPTYLNIEYFFGKILQFFQSVYYYMFYGTTGLLVKATVALICILLITLIAYLIIRLREMEQEHEAHVYHHAEHEGPTALAGLHQVLRDSAVDTSTPSFAAHTGISAFEPISGPVEEKRGQARWEKVIDHISSQHASDWRLAIIEADTMLDEMIEGHGYPGGSLGERLKNAGTGAFRTYQDAWEAHTVRNKIAHQGSEFPLLYRDAKQTIDRYENVFREFEYI